MTDQSAGLPCVLFVINSPIVGGAERHTVDLASYLASRGCRSAIFSMKSGPLSAPTTVDFLKPQGSRSLLQRIGDLRHLLASLRPDLIVSVNERPMFASSIARTLARQAMPILAIVHSTVRRNLREELMQRVYNRFFSRIDGVVFISRNQRNYWLRHGLTLRDEITILNGIDIDRYSPDVRALHRMDMRARLGFLPDEFVLGLCAVMRPEKNHSQAIKAVASLRQQGVAAKALLVGNGPMRRDIEALAASLGISDAIVFAGMQDDVRPFIAAFDVGCICSCSIETLSLAALEVMAMGIPMVMSDIGGASEIVDGRNGLLFPVGSDAGLRDALLRLNDATMRAEAGAAARQTVVGRFDRSAMMTRYFDHLMTFAPAKPLY